MAHPLHSYDLAGYGGTPDVTITWTEEDQSAALAEGWYLDEQDGAIQADPDRAWTSAGMQCAYAFVRDRAGNGSPLHIRAMILDGWAALDAWETRYRAARNQGAAHAG